VSGFFVPESETLLLGLLVKANNAHRVHPNRKKFSAKRNLFQALP